MSTGIESSLESAVAADACGNIETLKFSLDELAVCAEHGRIKTSSMR